MYYFFLIYSLLFERYAAIKNTKGNNVINFVIPNHIVMTKLMTCPKKPEISGFFAT